MWGSGGSSGQELFVPPGAVLFRLVFPVHTSSAADFYRFIQQVWQEISSRIMNPRYFGTGTTTVMLPRAGNPPNCNWFIIVLESRDRETNHSVRLFIEAETLYLHGYQNEHGDVFEFKPTDGKQYLSKKGFQPKFLPFSCNYQHILRSTKQKGEKGAILDPGLTLEPEEAWKDGKDAKATPRLADFGHRQLRGAVVKLAEGRNLPGESQHMTAQSLLLVIVRFCESMRFRRVLQEMVDLWNNPGSLSSHCLGMINNWRTIGVNLVDSDRYVNHVNRGKWSKELYNRTGVGNAAEAREVLALVCFHIMQEEDVEKGHVKSTDPDSGKPPKWDKDHNNPGRGGGSAGGSSFLIPGASGADEPPLPCITPEEPAMEILGVWVPQKSGFQGIYGSITVTDGLGAQTIYQGTTSRDNYQSDDYQVMPLQGDDDSYDMMSLELDTQKRPISAYDYVDIDVDLYADASTQTPLAMGYMPWNVFEATRYDQIVRRDVGEAALEYIVYSKAVQVKVSITVDSGGDAGARAWFTTTNTMLEALLQYRRYMIMRLHPVHSDSASGFLLRGEHVVAVPLGFKLQVTVGLEHEEGSPQIPVLDESTLELEPTEGGGTKDYTIPQERGTIHVNFAWNLIRMELPDQTISQGPPINDRDELK